MAKFYASAPTLQVVRRAVSVPRWPLSRADSIGRVVRLWGRGHDRGDQENGTAQDPGDQPDEAQYEEGP
jgi:hypothetical protein